MDVEFDLAVRCTGGGGDIGRIEPSGKALQVSTKLVQRFDEEILRPRKCPIDRRRARGHPDIYHSLHIDPKRSQMIQEVPERTRRRIRLPHT